MKTLVLYAFHEYNERVDFFIKNATFDDIDVHFLFICNDPIIDITVPKHIVLLKRPNHGYDFGAWSYGLFKADIYKSYDRFIFANSSIMGPYLPPDFKGKWTDIYLNGLQDNVKLFGSTVNCQFFLRQDIDINLHPILFSHLQSYIFSMDKQALEYLIKCEIFSIENHSDVFFKTIENKEVGMSRKIIENGWNIGCLMKRYQDVDFRFIYKKPIDYNIEFLGDIMFPEYENKVFTKEELVFIKGNRCPNILPPTVNIVKSNEEEDDENLVDAF